MKKKFTLFVALVVSVLLFPSCHKEGQYLPKKKITKIEHTATNGLHEIEEWVWNGQLLSSVTVKLGSGEIINEMTFKYDSDKRVESIRADYQDFVENYVFTYDGKDLVKISRQEVGDAKVDIFTFKKVDGNVVEITLSPVAAKSFSSVNLLRFILPSKVADQIKPTDAKVTTTYKLTWVGNNVTQLEALADGVSVMKTTWSYDKMINPFNGLYTSEFLTSQEELYSANNIIEETTVFKVMGIERTIHNNFEYKYDGKYPIECNWINDASGQQVSNTKKYYYK